MTAFNVSYLFKFCILPEIDTNYCKLSFTFKNIHFNCNRDNFPFKYHKRNYHKENEKNYMLNIGHVTDGWLLLKF